MRANPDQLAEDVMPELEGDGCTIRKDTLADSGQVWGDELPSSVFGVPGLFARMTRMIVTRCYDVSGNLAGVIWGHARTDSDGADVHEVWLPCAESLAQPYPPGTWFAISVEPLSLEQSIECPCGTRGSIRQGAWRAEAGAAWTPAIAGR